MHPPSPQRRLARGRRLAVASPTHRHSSQSDFHKQFMRPRPAHCEARLQSDWQTQRVHAIPCTAAQESCLSQHLYQAAFPEATSNNDASKPAQDNQTINAPWLWQHHPAGSPKHGAYATVTGHCSCPNRPIGTGAPSLSTYTSSTSHTACTHYTCGTHTHWRHLLRHTKLKMQPARHLLVTTCEST